ncbi:MAG: hypothetical protein IJL69_06725 [Oscillospiraceae bacterium]|nr:hypothetical protein [Oscillospiraceae bacterium]
MRSRVTRLAAAVLLGSLLFLSGCQGMTIFQSGTDVMTATGYRDAVSEAQRFSTKCLDSYEVVWSDDAGLYIYTGFGQGIPYVLIYRHAGLSLSEDDYLETVVRPDMQNSYGEDLLDASRLKEYTLGGRTMPGILFTYRLNEYTVKSLRLCWKTGDSLISFTAKYLDGEERATMAALETAIENFSLTGDTAVSGTPAVTAPVPGTSDTTAVTPAVTEPTGTEATTTESTTTEATTTESTTTEATTTEATTTAQQLKITPTESSQVRMTAYSDPAGYFTMEIPQGWTVKTGLRPSREFDLISFAIEVTDPRNPDRMLYFNLNCVAGLQSQEAHDWYVRYYGAGDQFAQMPVISPLSTAGLFEGMKTLYGYDAFSVLDTMPGAFGGDVLAATCTSAATGRTLEGLFAATVTANEYLVQRDMFDFFSGYVDVGLVTVYDVVMETAPQEEFLDWQPILDRCLGSIRFTEAFHTQRQEQWRRVMGTAQYLSRAADEMRTMLMDSWSYRSTTYDVISQKQSDATLGYERVYDTETGEYYKAELGFGDWYGGTRYQTVDTDEAYLAPVTGYIEWR